MSIAGAAGGAADALTKIIEQRRLQQQLEAEIANREQNLAQQAARDAANEQYRQRSLDVEQQRYQSEAAAKQREREETQGMQALTLSSPGRVDPNIAAVIQKNPVAGRLLKVRQTLPETEGVGPLQEPEIQREELPAERQQRLTNERLIQTAQQTAADRAADNARADAADAEQRRQFGITSGETAQYHDILAGAERERRANKPATGVERQTLGYYNRMKSALSDMDAVEQQVSDKDLLFINNSSLPDLINNSLLSPAGQQYVQALRTYTEARLRKESGAVIPPSEFEADRKAISRQVNDLPATITQKRKTRNQTAKGIGFASGNVYKEYYGEPLNLTDDDAGGGGDPLVVNGIRFPSAAAAAGYKREKGIK